MQEWSKQGQGLERELLVFGFGLDLVLFLFGLDLDSLKTWSWLPASPALRLAFDLTDLVHKSLCDGSLGWRNTLGEKRYLPPSEYMNSQMPMIG